MLHPSDGWLLLMETKQRIKGKWPTASLQLTSSSELSTDTRTGNLHHNCQKKKNYSHMH